MRARRTAGIPPSCTAKIRGRLGSAPPDKRLEGVYPSVQTARGRWQRWQEEGWPEIQPTAQTLGPEPAEPSQGTAVLAVGTGIIYNLIRLAELSRGTGTSARGGQALALRAARCAQSGRRRSKHITYSWSVTSVPLGKSLQHRILLNLLSHITDRISLKSSPSRLCRPSRGCCR